MLYITLIYRAGDVRKISKNRQGYYPPRDDSLQGKTDSNEESHSEL